MNETHPCKPGLENFLRERITAEGPLTFSRFMDHCLYHPQWGYYAAPRQRIGKEGDFFTSSSVHSLFGRLLFRQLRQMADLLDHQECMVVEQGAGEGHLCRDILDAAREEAPDLYERMRYVLIEIGDDGRQRQQNLLSEHLAAGRVHWSSLEELGEFEGCFLSNELVDAFPVHLVEQTSEGLKEIYVDLEGDHFCEKLGSVSTPAVNDYFAKLGLVLREGNRAEINLAAIGWMKDIARKLRRGFVLTIDYGYLAEELFSPLRRTGTLLCYHRHQSNERPLENIGCQDITSHVDFTTLQRVGEAHGLDSLYYGPQYRFLMGLGFLETLMELEAREEDPQKARMLRMTLKNLIMPDQGMGETFKVLIQGKDVGSPDLFCQRAMSDIRLPI